MDCEVCGSKNANRKSKIENVILNVCNNCVDLGRELTVQSVLPVRRRKIRLPEELNQVLVENFGKTIRKKRESINLNQEELAKKLSLKSSIINRIENGWEPPLDIIKKLERFFNIKLLEGTSEYKTDKTKIKNLTIGDIVDVK